MTDARRAENCEKQGQSNYHNGWQGLSGSQGSCPDLMKMADGTQHLFQAGDVWVDNKGAI